MHDINTPRNSFDRYIYKATRKFNAFLRHAAQSIFYFHQNAIYFLVLFLCSKSTFLIKPCTKI